MELNSNYDFSKFAEIVVNPYNSKSSEKRKGLMLTGTWDVSFLDFIRVNNIKALYLNSARGWATKDYSFLSDLSTIEELHIIAGDSINLEALEQMVCLEELSITTTTKSTIEFSRLPKLHKCFLSWWKEANSIFDSKTLKELYLDYYKPSKYDAISKLTSLESLTLGNSKIDNLTYIKPLDRLHKLELINCRKISDFKEISILPRLKWLAIDNNKNIHDLEFLNNLFQLEALLIRDGGEIDTIRTLINLRELRRVSFAGNTNILDGDLTPLTSLPKLIYLMLVPRKHYTHEYVNGWACQDMNSPEPLLKKKT